MDRSLSSAELHATSSFTSRRMNFTAMDLSQALYAIAVAHAGYLIQSCIRIPSKKNVTTQNESWIIWLMASHLGSTIARIATVVVAAHHVTVALAVSNTLQHSRAILEATCPTPGYLDPELFTLSPTVLTTLAVMYVGSWIRLRAFAQLGANFTYRIAKPDQLVTDGLYAYVRHPSYTGLLAVLVATYSLFFRQRGLVSCFAPLVDERLVVDERFGYLFAVVGFFIPLLSLATRRIQDEEKLMEKEFGKKWKEYCRVRKRLIPFVF